MVETRTLWNLGWSLFNFGEGSAWAVDGLIRPDPFAIQRVAECYMNCFLNLFTAYATEKEAGVGFGANGVIGFIYSVGHDILEYIPDSATNPTTYPAKSISRAIQPIVNIGGMLVTYPSGLRQKHETLTRERDGLKTERDNLKTKYGELNALCNTLDAKNKSLLSRIRKRKK